VADVERSRLLLGFNEWADLRILVAAEKLKPDEYAGLVAQFAHMLGTQRWWYAKWTGGEYGQHAVPVTIADAHAMFARSHDDLREFAAGLTEQALERSARWWGNEMELSVGELIVQVVNHGTQHRSELAITLTDRGCSPGDLDYLFFRLPQERFPKG
jgi:uncharacterized damage-inducible protein DinB